jgi:(p)ppGpp synthase/HD superfamily hydrolase
MNDKNKVVVWDKVNLGVLKCCSDDVNRATLQGVYFRNGKSIATNGFVSVEIAGVEVDRDDIPVPSGTVLGQLTDGVIISKEICKNLIKNLTKKLHPIQVFNCFWLVDKKETKFLTTVDIENGNLETHNKQTVNCISGDYPDVENIIPQGKPVNSIIFKVDELIKLLEVLGKVSEYVTVNIRDNELLVEIIANDERFARGYICPKRKVG